MLDPQFYLKMKQVFEDYRDASLPITAARMPLHWRLLFLSRLVREAL